MLQLLQPFQPYLNTVASPGLPLPVLQCFRPSVFLQALGTNLHITQLLFLIYFFAQALCPDSLHPLFKVRTHPIPHVTCHPTLHPSHTLQDKGIAAVSVIYERFVETPHFKRWFAQRRSAALTVPSPGPSSPALAVIHLSPLPSPLSLLPSPLSLGRAVRHIVCRTRRRAAAAFGDLG